jgi:predicted hydrolase (HD superfamily)
VTVGKRPTRQQAWELVCEYNEEPRHLRHALAVEATMRYMARKHSEDEEEWGIIGLVHDLDYEKHPEEHCRRTEVILRQQEWPEEWVRAVLSHAWGVCSDVEPHTLLEKTLYAVDELTGLVAATALVRPSQSVLDMKAKSVKKKWKDKHFAAGVDRSIIEKGAAMLGVELGDLITDVIMAMRERAAEIGLDGKPA